jgi:hypothetical protein
VKSKARKLNARIATGISDETVSKSGVVNPLGVVAKNSLKNLVSCPPGLSLKVVFNTTRPCVSVRMRFTPPDPVEGFATAIAVELSAIAPTVTRIDALVVKGTGARTVCSTPAPVRFSIVSVETSPAGVPETSVITANPVCVVPS